MAPAKLYILLNTLIALMVLLLYSYGAVARLQEDHQREAQLDLERSLAVMKELLAAKGEFRLVDGNLLAGDYVINGNYEIPDKIGKIFGGAATVFLYDTRISTNIRTASGERATGTKLEGPAYRAVIVEGRPFRGETTILGVPYLTVYDPIKDREGRLIGILFNGVKKSALTEALDYLKTQLYLLLVGLAVVLTIPALFITNLSARHEKARQAQVTFLQTVIDTIPNPVYYKDASGRYLGCNKSLERALGATRDDFIGKTVDDFYPPDVAEIHRQQDAQVLAQRRVLAYEATIPLHDKQLHDVVFFKAPYPGPENEPGGIVGSFIDMTDIREMERKLREEREARSRDLAVLAEKEKMLMQQNRQALLGEMIGNIAHQWRQPLNALGLIAQEVLFTYEHNGFTKQYLEETTGRIRDVTEHLSETIDQFSGFFRPEKSTAGFMPGQVIEKTIRLVEAGLKSAQMEILTRVSHDVQVVGYPNEYSQVIMNILMNARDAFNERNVSVQRTVEIEIAASPGTSIVTITDNAGGIAEDVIPHVFQSYFTTKETTGTGIGLYLAKTIIESHMHGSITVSNTGTGASFRVEVPSSV